MNKKQENELMESILRVYVMLSPENISGDGEHTRSQIEKLRKQYNAELKKLFTELGRVVDETEAWNWSEANRK